MTKLLVPFCFVDIVIFDNSYSWTKSKKMMYWVELLEPADEDPDKEPKFQEAVSDSLQDMDIFEWPSKKTSQAWI